jgi:hypothetical protein
LFLALRTLRYSFRSERPDAETASIAQALCGSELRVLSGPFAGLEYFPFASGSALLPKLVGSYELEIHPAVEAAIERGYRRVVNVGCGEGYYAVGFARRLPEAEIHAFDTDIVARQRARQLARKNGVAERVRVKGLCHPAKLRRLVGPGTLVVCDCEGCEIRLLDPVLVPELAATDLIVELHDFIDPTISTRVLDRFRHTHRIEIFSMTDRSALRLAALAVLEPVQRKTALLEGRPEGMQWAWIQAREGKA